MPRIEKLGLMEKLVGSMNHAIDNVAEKIKPRIDYVSGDEEALDVAEIEQDNFLTLNPKKINVKRVAKAGLLAGLVLYAANVVSPFINPGNVIREDKGLVLAYNLLNETKDSDVETKRRVLRSLELSSFSYANIERSYLSDDDYVKRCFSEVLRPLESIVRRDFMKDANNTFRELKLPKDAKEALPKDVNLVNVPDNFYGDIKTSTRQGEFKYGNYLFVRQNSENGFIRDKQSLAHENWHMLVKGYFGEDYSNVLRDIDKNLVKEKFKARNFARKDKILWDSEKRKSFAFQEEVNYNDALPIEILVEHLAALSIGINAMQKNNTLEHDLKTTAILNDIISKYKGKDWDKDWRPISENNKTRINVLNYTENLGKFAYLNATYPIIHLPEEFGERASRLNGMIKNAYRDYSQKLGWVLEDNPTESALALQLGIVAGVGGLGYSLLRRKEEKTCQDELHFTESYSQEYKQPEKSKVNRIDRESYRQFWQSIGRKKEKNYTAGMRERR